MSLILFSSSLVIINKVLPMAHTVRHNYVRVMTKDQLFLILNKLAGFERTTWLVKFLRQIFCLRIQNKLITFAKSLPINTMNETENIPIIYIHRTL